jgi:cytochrome c oxidase cbb3-type subunit 3
VQRKRIAGSGRAPAFVAFVAFGVLAGCDRPPSDSNAKEWSAADHERAPGEGASARQAPAQKERKDDPAALAEVAWTQQCAQCHGPTGRGDGPMGPMVNAPNLNDPALQESLTDERIAASIRNGKGRMPKFDLPDPLVAALVARVRALGGPRGNAP